MGQGKEWRCDWLLSLCWGDWLDKMGNREQLCLGQIPPTHNAGPSMPAESQAGRSCTCWAPTCHGWVRKLPCLEPHLSALEQARQYTPNGQPVLLIHCRSSSGFSSWLAGPTSISSSKMARQLGLTSSPECPCPPARDHQVHLKLNSAGVLEWLQLRLTQHRGEAGEHLSPRT